MPRVPLSMIATLTSYVEVVLLCILLYQTCADPYTIRCFFPQNETEDSSSVDVSDMEEAPDRCKKADRIELVNEDIFDTVNISENVLKWILEVKEVGTCLLIQRRDSVTISVKNEIINGNCTGPLLSIINNDKLKSLTIKSQLLKNLAGASEKIVLVRGNKELLMDSLGSLRNYPFIDLQQERECGTPMPFIGFEFLEKCQRLYGPLYVTPTTSSIHFSKPLRQKFKYEGCLNIRNTTLLDVLFLEAFSDVKKMPGCEHQIRDNEVLCISNLRFIITVFDGVTLSNNKEICEYCVGGNVTEEYLRLNTGCKHVYGDMKIVGWTDRPAHVGVLMGIKSIDGLLIIENNRNLLNFTFFCNLTTVGKRGACG